MSSELIKAAVILIIAAVLITVLRTRLGEYSILLTLVTVAVVLIAFFGNLLSGIERLQDLFGKSGNAGVYFTTALKALGISYITSFAADLCRDFGMSSLAQTAELAGKIAIFVLSMPLMSALLDAVLKFVGL